MIKESKWLKELLINSSTMVLQQKVSAQHDKLQNEEHGAITYFKMMMIHIVEIKDEVVKVAKELIVNFSLQKIQGENVYYTKIRMMEVASILHQGGQLVKDHYNAVLNGLVD